MIPKSLQSTVMITAIFTLENFCWHYLDRGARRAFWGFGTSEPTADSTHPDMALSGGYRRMSRRVSVLTKCLVPSQNLKVSNQQRSSLWTNTTTDSWPSLSNVTHILAVRHRVRILHQQENMWLGLHDYPPEKTSGHIKLKMLTLPQSPIQSDEGSAVPIFPI